MVADEEQWQSMIVRFALSAFNMVGMFLPKCIVEEAVAVQVLMEDVLELKRRSREAEKQKDGHESAIGTKRAPPFVQNTFIDTSWTTQ